VVLSSFLVDLVEPGTAAAEGARITAHIRRVDDTTGALAERGFKLGNSVLDVVSGLLLDLVREDDGSSD